MGSKTSKSNDNEFAAATHSPNPFIKPPTNMTNDQLMDAKPNTDKNKRPKIPRQIQIVRLKESLQNTFKIWFNTRGKMEQFVELSDNFQSILPHLTIKDIENVHRFISPPRYFRTVVESEAFRGFYKYCHLHFALKITHPQISTHITDCKALHFQIKLNYRGEYNGIDDWEKNEDKYFEDDAKWNVDIKICHDIFDKCGDWKTKNDVTDPDLIEYHDDLWNELNNAVVGCIWRDNMNDLLNDDIISVIMDYYASFSVDLEFDDPRQDYNTYQLNFELKYKKNGMNDIGLKIRDEKWKWELMGYCMCVDCVVLKKFCRFIGKKWLNTVETRKLLHTMTEIDISEETDSSVECSRVRFE